jgi:hypothetical protein
MKCGDLQAALSPPKYLLKQRPEGLRIGLNDAKVKYPEWLPYADV